MKKSIFFLAIVYFASGAVVSLFGQSDSLLNLISDISEDETYYTDILLDLEEQPIHLNYADKSDFMLFPLLTNEMADTIIEHREKYGSYKFIRQLREIIDPQIYELLKPYITTHDKGYHESQIIHRQAYRIKSPSDFTSKNLNSYTRIKYQSNPYTNFGIVIQKDPGEDNIVDHLNFFGQYKRNGWNVVLGNYYIQFGHGLSHSNPYGNQKSTFLSAVFREPSSIVRPNISSSESSGKFGIFVEKNVSESFSTFGFFSNSQRDARLTDNVLTGFDFDGYHISESDIERRKYFSEQNVGGGIKYNPYSWLEVSTIINQYNFSEPIQNSEEIIGENTRRRNYFDFSGDELTQAGFSYILNISNLKLSGEYSTSSLGNPGWAQTAYFSKYSIKLGIKYWKLDKNFQTIDGRSFDSSTPFPQGVKGFFAGIQFRITKRSTFSAYKKAEQKTWRTYTEPFPTAKSEWLTQWDYHYSKVTFTSRFRHRVFEDFTSGEAGNQRRDKELNNIRLQVDFKPIKTVATRTRWEHTIAEGPKEKGTLFFYEVNYSYSPSLSLSTRYTFFNTASWDSRIYEYERGLPGTFSNIALSDNGNKMYLLLKWKVLQNLSLWFKWKYISKNDLHKNGRYYKDLNRDIQAQIQLSL